MALNWQKTLRKKKTENPSQKASIASWEGSSSFDLFGQQIGQFRLDGYCRGEEGGLFYGIVGGGRTTHC